MKRKKLYRCHPGPPAADHLHVSKCRNGGIGLSGSISQRIPKIVLRKLISSFWGRLDCKQLRVEPGSGPRVNSNDLLLRL